MEFPNWIEQRRVERVTEVLPSRELWEFKPTRAVWVARWLWWGLRKLRAIHIELPTVERVVYTDLQSKKLHDAIWEAMENAHVNWREPHEVIMGPETLKELTHSPTAHEILQFRVGPYMRGGSHEIYGVPVRVIPWIKGWAVL